MTKTLTFVIPIRHPENCTDWPKLVSRLSQTVSSISAQTNTDWRAVLVANHGADLPQFPRNVEVERVDFPPNPIFDRGAHDLETFYDAFRLDKGRRVLAGMLAARDTQYFMISDDDDFVSRKIVDYVAHNKGANGWYIRTGWVWSDGGGMIYRYNEFDQYCGTSLIIRSDLYQLPTSLALASGDYIRRMLGSHIYIKSHLADLGTPLVPLPFPGAVYRIGHADAHSKSSGLIEKFFTNRDALKRPLHTLWRLRNLRPVGSKISDEFFARGL